MTDILLLYHVFYCLYHSQTDEQRGCLHIFLKMNSKLCDIHSDIYSYMSDQ